MLAKICLFAIAFVLLLLVTACGDPTATNPPTSTTPFVATNTPVSALPSATFTPPGTATTPVSTSIPTISPAITTPISPTFNIDISLSTSSAKVGDTIKISATLRNMGIPQYSLIVDGETLAYITYNNVVPTNPVSSSAFLQLVSASGSMTQAEFVVKTLKSGSVKIQVNANGEITVPNTANSSQNPVFIFTNYTSTSLALTIS